MKSKTQLQKENVELRTQLEIRKHTKDYIRVPYPGWNVIARVLALLGSVGLAVANFLLLTYTWKLLNISVLFGTEEEIIANKSLIGFHQLLICYPLIGEYLLIGLSIICLVALIKGGFNKLKPFNKDGLIFDLMVGLIGSLIEEFK